MASFNVYKNVITDTLIVFFLKSLSFEIHYIYNIWKLYNSKKTREGNMGGFRRTISGSGEEERYAGGEPT